MRNTKLLALVAFAAGLSLVLAVSAMATEELTPKPRPHTMSRGGEIISESGDVIFTKQAAVGDTVWIRVHDDSRCDDPHNTQYGGQGTGAAPGYATWCWERGQYAPGFYDSCSSTTAYGGVLPGCFTHYDVYSLLSNQWHLDSLLAYPVGGAEDSTPWCGEWGNPLVWVNGNSWGYGPQYNWSLILNLGTPDSTGFSSADGFTVGGVHMYDVEINYDYCYLEYATSNNDTFATWWEIDRFNGTSAPTPPPTCQGTADHDYGCANYESFEVVGPPTDNSAKNLMIRWRFASDSAFDDEDASNGVHTDGAWRIDHVYVKGEMNVYNSYYPFGDPTRTAVEDFEQGMPAEWSTPTFPQAQIYGFWSGGVWVNGTPVWVDWWHLENDPTYANYGNTCEYSNTWMWAADDEAHNQNVEDAYHYRLVSPVFNTSDANIFYDPDPPGPGEENRWTGVVVESDEYLCIKDIVGDVTDTQARVYDSSIGSVGTWSQWQGDNYVIVGGCQFWNVDQFESWSQYLTPAIDSIQFSWEFLDRCDYNTSSPIPCMGQHRKATYLIDNISVGVFSAEATQWAQGASERFADTFARDVPMHSLFKENWELTPGDLFEQEDSLTIQARDVNGLMAGSPPLNSSVKIHWRISTDCGGTWDIESSRPMGTTTYPTETWNEKTMNFSAPDDSIHQNGGYATIVTVADNVGYLGGLTLWPEGTVMEYFFSAIDSSGNRDTLPNRNSLLRNSEDLLDSVTINWHDYRRPWPYDVKVLPCPTTKRPLPGLQNHSVLVADGFGRNSYDIEGDPDFSGGGITAFVPTNYIWRATLDRLGIMYDFYRVSYGVSRGNSPIYSQPFDNDHYGGVIDHTGPSSQRRYNTVIWFFGTFNGNTVVDSSQLEAAIYIDRSGVIFNDSANLWVAGDDLCEDLVLSDPGWIDPISGNNTTNGAFFWTKLAGLQPNSGGINCPDDEGHDSQNGVYRFYIKGVTGTCLEGITKAVGYWDCPIRQHPDDGARLDSASALQQYSDALGSTEFATAYRRHDNGSKVVLSFVGLEDYSNSQERDCVAQAILGGCFNVGIPVPRAGCTIDVSVPGGAVPARMVLDQNKPNPFNPTTSISFSVPAKSHVTLKIYDIAGREVRTLVDDVMEASERTVTWQGLDNKGRSVTSGVYFYRLDAGKETATKKMVLLR